MSSVDSMTSEWDVLVCVFAVFSHTVQLLGVIGSIHIEPSVVSVSYTHLTLPTKA